MSLLAIIKPLAIAAIDASRGSGAANLATRDPKEAWIDGAAGTQSVLTVDLGSVQQIDTIFLGYVTAAAGAIWSITAGVGAAGETVVLVDDTLRVPDVDGHFAPISHGYWTGAQFAARYLAIAVTQPAGAAPLSAGIVLFGRAFVPELGKEWGSGRQVIDTGSVTPLPSGGFAIVEGVRKRLFSWVFGDLSFDETDRLELIALAVGETAPGLVVEDTTRSPGLRSRIHYGLFKPWPAYDRRNRRQTRWELKIEEWV